MLAFILAVIMSLEADFVQTKHVALMNEPQVSTGHMTYRAPDYIQWAYAKPQVIVWEMDGDKSNVNPQVQKLLRMIMSAIAGGEVDNPQLQRETKRIFKSVHITMDEKNEVAKRVELEEKNGDTTIIEFAHVVKK
ncbi:MAG: outer membrane lipoprotein carrier protein LolA [Paludibacteraceae bacterium]|nr:outer membrane lipoprotein carrier protein LolA [Paludibacteraceae bacterium]